MADNHLNLFCLVDGESTSNAFSIKIPLNDTVDDIKKAIKVQKSVAFADVDADMLTLWCVSIPDDDNDNDKQPILLDILPEKKKLKATAKLSKVIDTELPEDTIHIIISNPLQTHAPGFGQNSTLPPSQLLDESEMKTVRRRHGQELHQQWKPISIISVSFFAILTIVTPLKGNPNYDQGSIETLCLILTSILIF
ncbi:hypothetical protein BGZ49_000187, partial [Haplosporangium sp. Z 27]